MEYDFSEEKLNKVEEEDIILEGDQDLKNNQKLINEEREEKEENNNIKTINSLSFKIYMIQFYFILISI